MGLYCAVNLAVTPRGTHQPHRVDLSMVFAPILSLAQGMPGCSGEPSVTTLVCFVLFRTRGCGCSAHPALPVPSSVEGVRAKLGRIAPRECTGLRLGSWKI